MRLVLQRVHRAKVEADGVVTGSIGRGLLILLGIRPSDGPGDVTWLCDKVPRIRVFEDDTGRMNRSLSDIAGDVMVISQFTLYGNLRKGTRPSFNDAAPPEVAEPLYRSFLLELEASVGRPVAAGSFGACMRIESELDGPVTLILDSGRKDPPRRG